MTYQASIPLPGDKPSVSQGDILNNFTQLNTQFAAEHNAFNSAAHDGKHKYVTLQRSAGLPPAGTNVALSQANTPTGNPYFQFITPAKVFQVPISYKITGIAIAAGSHTVNLFDFATFGLPANNAFPQMGTVILYDEQAPTAYSRTILSPFAYIGGTLYCPGTAGQLVAGSQYARFDTAGTVLQVITNAVPAGDTATLIITGISV